MPTISLKINHLIELYDGWIENNRIKLYICRGESFGEHKQRYYELYMYLQDLITDNITDPESQIELLTSNIEQVREITKQVLTHPIEQVREITKQVLTESIK